MNKHLQRHMDQFPTGGAPGFASKFGRWWTAPIAEERPVLAMPNRCFANAQMFLIETQSNSTNSLTYVEGYAGDPELGFVPIHHAWLVDVDGRVVDPTWTNSHECAYFGVPFKSSFILRLVADRKNIGHDIFAFPGLRLTSERNRHLWDEAVATTLGVLGDDDILHDDR